jgi:hypothetical protein
MISFMYLVVVKPRRSEVRQENKPQGVFDLFRKNLICVMRESRRRRRPASPPGEVRLYLISLYRGFQESFPTKTPPSIRLLDPWAEDNGIIALLKTSF